jgi:hypothetical protein
MSVDLFAVDGAAADTLPAAYVAAAIADPTPLTQDAAPAPVAVLVDFDVYGDAGVLTKRIADRGLMFQLSGTSAVVGYDIPNEAFAAVHLADVQLAYEPRLMEGLEIQQSVLDAADLGGRAALTVAQFDLWNGDRAYDDIAKFGQALGRSVTIRTVAAPKPYASDAGGSFGSAVTVFKGVVAAFGAPAIHIPFSVSDLSEKLAQPLQPNLFAGTGGVEGSSDLKGRPKPIALGYPVNITPVYLGLVDFGDGALPTYQSNWRQVIAHDVVRARGASIAQTSGVPAVGQYRDWPQYGCFQIGFTADGAITCNVKGDAPGGLYAGSTAGLVERVLTGSLGPGLSGSDLDSDSFARTALVLPGEVGWFSGTESVTGEAALAQILTGAGGVLAGARDGTLHMAALAVTNTVAMFDVTAPLVRKVVPVALPASLSPPPAIVKIAAQKNWTVLSDIAGVVTGADRDALANEGRTATVTSALIAARQAVSRELSLQGLYRYESDALARATQISAWIEGGLRAFEVTLERYPAQLRIGHYGKLTYPRFGLDGGFYGTVFARRESPGGRFQTITMIGWGNVEVRLPRQGHFARRELLRLDAGRRHDLRHAPHRSAAVEPRADRSDQRLSHPRPWRRHIDRRRGPDRHHHPQWRQRAAAHVAERCDGDRFAALRFRHPVGRHAGLLPGQRDHAALGGGDGALHPLGHHPGQQPHRYRPRAVRLALPSDAQLHLRHSGTAHRSHRA